jgi:hypothetical protein
LTSLKNPVANITEDEQTFLNQKFSREKKRQTKPTPAVQRPIGWTTDQINKTRTHSTSFGNDTPTVPLRTNRETELEGKYLKFKKKYQAEK